MKLVTWLILLCLSSQGAAADLGKQASVSRCAAGIGTAFSNQALALSAGGAVHCLGLNRTRLVEAYKRVDDRQLPRYAGAGETSIHKAIHEAERLTRQGARRQAMHLILELDADLRRANKTGEIDALMAKWNARYPAELPVDILSVQVPQFMASLDALWDALGNSPGDSDFMDQLQTMVRTALEKTAEEMHYATLGEMVRDVIEAEAITTPFQVQLPPSLRRLVGGSLSIVVTVVGLPTLLRVTLAILDQFRVLDQHSLTLKVDGRDVESAYEIVLPSQRLELIVTDPPEGGAGSHRGTSGAA